MLDPTYSPTVDASDPSDDEYIDSRTMPASAQIVEIPTSRYFPGAVGIYARARLHSSLPTFGSASRARRVDTPEPSDDERIIVQTTPSKNVGNPSSGFFTGAVGADARYGTFTENILNITYQNPSPDVERLLAELKPVDRSGYYVPRCMDGTREYIFKEVDKWLHNVDEPNILWVSGGPGAGKSAIASSMMQNLLKDCRLGSSFFFRRGDDALSDPAALWRTVACDLAQRDGNLAKIMVEALGSRRSILQAPDIDSHFKFLIEEPLKKHYEHSTPPVIVIDALDECGSDASQAPLRKAFLNTLVRWTGFGKAFKLIITGRNDRVPDALRVACKQIVLPTGGDVSDDASRDIRTFFEKGFSELVGSSFPEWPGEQVLTDLTVRAAGLFIWAEIVMKLLAQGIPDDQLDLIIRGHLGDGDNLTNLYCQVLFLSFQGTKGRTLEVYKLVASAIVLSRIPLHSDDLPQFLSQTKPAVKFILNKLSSVVSEGPDKRLRICHLSFTEFLCDPERCPKEFFIDRQKESQNLGMTCFERMKERLKFNICGLKTSHLLNDEVENLTELIEKHIPGSLSYSCRFWAAHLRDTASMQDDRDVRLLDEVKDFFYNRFLFWLEVMSLIKEVGAANAGVVTAIPWIEKFDAPLSGFARDASRFIINFDIPISHSVPHIYLSALPFSPSNSLTARRYQPQFPNTLCILRGSNENWPALVGLCHGHTDEITSVALSPDGKWAVSGSQDKSVRIWDVKTGQVCGGPFKGHTDRITSVAFSPDGKNVVSGSHDKTICIWDIETGQISAGPFEGHTDCVTSVALSPDGKNVVSGSDDETICIWDIETGQISAGPFEGHTDFVTSVAFSPDGKNVVSGSFDKTICIWDIETEQISAGPFEGHTRCVTSVAFSPDGKNVVSGSYDMTICIWDIDTGQISAGPFEGHTDWVRSVAFSPDGKNVVSGSSDKTICTWDVETGQISAGPFEGHTDFVTSVAFSPDGKNVISGSYDMTICIWDVETGQISAGPFEGHTDWVTSVALSPDGKNVVSGLYDKMICIWDIETRQISAGPFEGHTDCVTSVALSPDGKNVVSGSHDETLCIWDIETGQISAGPFEGHTDWVTSVAFSPDGKNVISGSFDKTICIWDIETGQISAGPFEGHTGQVTSVVFSPDGKNVVSGSYDKTICIWDVKTGQISAGPFQGHTDWVTSVALSPDGKNVVSGSRDMTICIWDIETGQISVGPFEGHTDWVTSVVFSPDGKNVVSGSCDKTICIWDVETGQVSAGPFNGHTDIIESVAFLPDGKNIVSGSRDMTIRIWDVQTRQPIPDLFQSHPVLSSDYVDDSGWLMRPNDSTGEHRLLWIPNHLRLTNGLYNSETLLIIGKRTIELDLHKFVHGHRWMECYSPQSASIANHYLRASGSGP